MDAANVFAQHFAARPMIVYRNRVITQVHTMCNQCSVGEGGPALISRLR